MEVLVIILLAFIIALCLMSLFIGSRGGRAYDCILWQVLALLAVLLRK